MVVLILINPVLNLAATSRYGTAVYTYTSTLRVYDTCTCKFKELEKCSAVRHLRRAGSTHGVSRKMMGYKDRHAVN